jgi:hypothetical protein
MSISIEARRLGEAEWKHTKGYSSLEAAKAACCAMRKTGFGSQRLTMEFRIYHNDTLYLVNAPDCGWRLRWLPGNGKSRKEQA